MVVSNNALFKHGYCGTWNDAAANIKVRLNPKMIFLKQGTASLVL
jgi:hypothetical protein